MSDKFRNEFELAIAKEFQAYGAGSPDLARGGNSVGEDYRSSIVSAAWWGYRASRAALVIELPQIVGYEAGYDSIRDNDFAALPDEFFDADEVFSLNRSIEVIESIEAAGVKCK